MTEYEISTMREILWCLRNARGVQQAIVNIAGGERDPDDSGLAGMLNAVEVSAENQRSNIDMAIDDVKKICPEAFKAEWPNQPSA